MIYLLYNHIMIITYIYIYNVYIYIGYALSNIALRKIQKKHWCFSKWHNSPLAPQSDLETGETTTLPETNIFAPLWNSVFFSKMIQFSLFWGQFWPHFQGRNCWFTGEGYRMFFHACPASSSAKEAINVSSGQWTFPGLWKTQRSAKVLRSYPLVN